jgi:hypothetical protein
MKVLLLKFVVWGRLPKGQIPRMARYSAVSGGEIFCRRRNIRASADKKKGAAGAAPCVHEWRIVAAVQALREEKTAAMHKVSERVPPAAHK